jgi:quercetin dioxygenase-like cupin family protein
VIGEQNMPNMQNTMKDFPDFMKSPLNAIDPKMQTLGNIGYVFDGKDGSQMAFWTSTVDIVSKEHVHDFDEYFIVVHGQYTLIIDENRHILHSGDEYLIPKGTPHAGESIQGTRTIHVFGAKRAKRMYED